MPTLRSLLASAARASIAGALASAPGAAAAQTAASPPAAAPASSPTPPTPPTQTPASEEPKPLLPFRAELDLYGALTYRLGSGGGGIVERGGGQLGVAALAGPRAGVWTAGLGYERSFFGTETLDQEEAGEFTDVERGMDALWLLGRVYPYQSADTAIFVTLGVGPAWQRVAASGTVVEPDQSGSLRVRTVSCSVSDSAGLGLRGGFGAHLSISDYLGFHAALGLEHQRQTGGVVEGCAPGLGSDTFLGGRFGFTFTEGRMKPKPRPAAPPPPPPPADADRDGIVDAADACPQAAGVPNPEPAKHGCPLPGDRDGDRITDDVDACPDTTGVPDQDPRKHGCPPPPDRDGDKVIDPEDACADIPGVASTDPATNGCPPDTDGDGIRDDKDACPQQKGLPDEDASKHGCPLVMVTEQEITIGQQVQFETARAVIRPVSYPLLDEVANVIKQHTDILKIEVQGHTDKTGNRPLNKILSQSRADAVKKALVQRGVDVKRLDAKGYGDAEPLADNATEEGKARNRRVQFKIVERAKK